MTEACYSVMRKRVVLQKSTWRAKLAIIARNLADGAVFFFFAQIFGEKTYRLGGYHHTMAREQEYWFPKLLSSRCRWPLLIAESFTLWS